MAWYAAYLLLGAVAGFLAGLFGVGGGLVLVPVLVLLFEAQHIAPDHLMHLALGTSMATILFTSFASLRKHHQYGAVNWQIVRQMTPGILLGTAFGAMTASFIPTVGLSILFALFVYCAAVQILVDSRPQTVRQLPSMFGMTVFGALTGWISSLVAIGGGTLVVPFLLWCNLSIRNAVGTSAAISFPVAVGGTAGYIAIGAHLKTLPPWHLGYVYLPAMFWVALAATLAAPLGARLAHRLQTKSLRKLFAVLLIMLATKLLFKAIGKL